MRRILCRLFQTGIGNDDSSRRKKDKKAFLNDSRGSLALADSGLFLQLVVILVLFVFSLQTQQSSGQSISVDIIQPCCPDFLTHEDLSVAAQVSSTYQLQSLLAFVEDRTNQLAFSAPDWRGIVNLAGLSRGNKVLTVVATDVFGNSNQAQRSIVYDLPPTLIVTSPPDGTVVRSGLHVAASATDDGPTAPYIELVDQYNYYGRVTNTLDTNLFLGDGQALTLNVVATDSLGQNTTITKQVYVQLSSNLVEVTRVSDGEIQDVDGDRILFLSNVASTNRLMIKSLSTGTETLLYQTSGVSTAVLTPSGVAFSQASVYEYRSGSLLRRGTWASSGLFRKGNFLFWGNDSILYLGDLLTTNTTSITNLGGYNDSFYSDGSIFLGGGNSIQRYRAGVFSVLASDPNITFDHPQTDGSSVCCFISGSVPYSLVFLTNGTTGAKIADNPGEYQMNNGWIAYTRDDGTDRWQVWRRAPDGTTVQLTFFGSSSTLGAVAPNGEVAFYNNSHLYISKGSWPPMDVGLTSTNYLGAYLKPFWQNNWWYATIGGSLFRIYTGSTQIINQQFTGNSFRFDLIGAMGQQMVSQSSTDLVHWTDFATNNIGDGANMSVIDTGLAGVPGKYYRFKTQEGCEIKCAELSFEEIRRGSWVFKRLRHFDLAVLSAFPEGCLVQCLSLDSFRWI